MRKATTHSFVLVLSGISEPDGQLEDSLYEAGCSDAILAFRNGVAYLAFDREAKTLASAVLSAVRDVERADHRVRVSHVEPDDLVSASEIARRLECSREYVRLLWQGERGGGDFPTPLSGVASTTFLWSWVDVVQWSGARNKWSDKSNLAVAVFIRDINGALRVRMDPSIIKRGRELLRELGKGDSDEGKRL
jgi:DNA-binding CsgD family transcriptional regulator